MLDMGFGFVEIGPTTIARELHFDIDKDINIKEDKVGIKRNT